MRRYEGTNQHGLTLQEVDISIREDTLPHTHLIGLQNDRKKHYFLSRKPSSHPQHPRDLLFASKDSIIMAQYKEGL